MICTLTPNRPVTLSVLMTDADPEAVAGHKTNLGGDTDTVIQADVHSLGSTRFGYVVSRISQGCTEAASILWFMHHF